MHCGKMYVELNSMLKLCLIFCVLIQGILEWIKRRFAPMFVRKKVAIMATNLTDGHTIPCTQDAGASPTKEPSYHLGGQEMESHLCRKDN